MRATVSQIQTIPYTNEKITKIKSDKNLKMKRVVPEKPTEIKQFAIIEATNLNTLKDKIMNLVKEGATNPVILELDSEAKGSFQVIKQADNNKNKYSDELFIVGKNFELNDPEAIFEIIVKSPSRQNFNNYEQTELIRIIGKNLHDVIVHKKYFLQLRGFDGPITSVTNRLRDAIAIWPKDKQSTSMKGSTEERLKTLRQKLRTHH